MSQICFVAQVLKVNFLSSTVARRQRERIGHVGVNNLSPGLHKETLHVCIDLVCHLLVMKHNASSFFSNNDNHSS